MRTGIGRTDIGKVRSKNQDALFVQNDGFGGLVNLYIVADGMGGHKAGEVASQKAIEAFCAYLEENPGSDLEGHDLEKHLRVGVIRANRRVFEMQKGNNDWRGMGTTFSLCTIKDDALTFAHVGDSRIYAVGRVGGVGGGGGLRLVSDDHSLTAELLRLGKITEDEARSHPHKNIMTRALGTENTLDVDTGSIKIARDERILICSDGLNNMVTDERILAIMNEEGTDAAKADALVAAALENGGKDNISLILISSLE